PGPEAASVRLDDFVKGCALGRLAAAGAGSGNQLRGVETDAVVRAGHAGDVLLHQGAAEVVDPPAEALGRGVEPHLHPARLEVGDRPAEGQPEGCGVLEVLLARDLL